MKYSKLTKALTLLFFTGMIASFLLYRTGTFDEKINEHIVQESPNGSVLKTGNFDTSIVPKKKFFRRRARMSSSKLLVVTDDLDILSKESNSNSVRLRNILKTLQKEQQPTSIKKPVKEQEVFFSSSKSGAIFKSESPLFDSLFTPVLKWDSTDKQKKKIKQ